MQVPETRAFGGKTRCRTVRIGSRLRAVAGDLRRSCISTNQSRSSRARKCCLPVRPHDAALFGVRVRLMVPPPIPQRIPPLTWRQPAFLWTPLALAVAIGWPAVLFYNDYGLQQLVVIAGRGCLCVRAGDAGRKLDDPPAAEDAAHRCDARRRRWRDRLADRAVRAHAIAGGCGGLFTCGRGGEFHAADGDGDAAAGGRARLAGRARLRDRVRLDRAEASARRPSRTI